ncbi:hypothetical protein TRAPUB_13948 [Trametes pubescens]|uniref:Uncharacterized protein n=1 Tax=Trametes pubescens TaxID=154538 RepID=A0A1M2VPP9_TRAPU|nr:hypothetical protein TRAPUB_13948 [Trametes pubescens]
MRMRYPNDALDVVAHQHLNPSTGGVVTVFRLVCGDCPGKPYLSLLETSNHGFRRCHQQYVPAYGEGGSILTTADERLLAAARSDNEDMLLEVFDEGKFDINAQDGASNGYLEILEHILEHEDCDVDPQNRIEKATPLHLALRIEDQDTRTAVVSSLLEAGADTRIKDKNGETVFDLVSPEDTEIRTLLRKSQAQASISKDDVADDDDDDEGEYSGSGSDEE